MFAFAEETGGEVGAPWEFSPYTGDLPLWSLGLACGLKWSRESLLPLAAVVAGEYCVFLGLEPFVDALLLLYSNDMREEAEP